jgi:hypothetical protein
VTALALSPTDRKARLRHLDDLLWAVEDANLREVRPSAEVARQLRREGIQIPNGTPLGFEAISRLFACQIPYLNLSPGQRRKLECGIEAEDDPD